MTADVGAHLGRRTLRDLLAVVEHGDPVADAHDHLHVVLDQQDGQAQTLAKLADEVGQLARLLRVHAGGRLVEQEELGLGGQGPGDLEPSLVAVGQVPRQLVGTLLEPHEIQKLLSPRMRLDLLASDPGCPQDGAEPAPLEAMVQADQHVVLGGHVPEQPDVLERAGDPDADHLMWLARR